MSESALFAKAAECVMDHMPSVDRVPFQRGPGHLMVGERDEGGFPVQLKDGRDMLQVFHSFWHDNFTKPEEAAKCFLFGLTTAAHLQLSLRGRSPYRWNMHTYANGERVSIGYVNLFLVPFWRKRSVIRFQNSWLSAEELKPWVDEHFADAPLTNLGPNQSLNRHRRAARNTSCP